MSIPVVKKYMACTELDPATETCAAAVWVDMPTLLPKLSAQHGAALGAVICLIWLAAYVAGPMIRKGASTRSY